MSYRLGGLGCGGFSAGRDMNGMLWERVTADQGPESEGSSECSLSAFGIPCSPNLWHGLTTVVVLVA
jgi:hypothetical protein